MFSATPQSCSKAGRTMDAVSAFRKISKCENPKKTYEGKRILSYAKTKSEMRHEDYGPFGFIEKLEAEKLTLCHI